MPARVHTIIPCCCAFAPGWTKFITLKYKYHCLIANMVKPMKNSVFFSLIMVTGCLLVTGCAMETPGSNLTPGLTRPPTPAITPFVNTTTVPTPAGMETTGKLTVSTGGWLGEFPVSVDTIYVGDVSADKPLVLMLEEGYHTVELCCNMRCEQQTADIRFGKQRIIDFSEQLKRDLKFAVPTAQVAGYHQDSGQITIDMEFINPTPRPLAMSADVSASYSYIESRSYNRMSGIVHSHVTANVNGCDRTTQTVIYYLASGYGYVYDNFPTITNITSV